MKKVYCVYHHISHEVIFYIGCGNKKRAHSKTQRNRLWFATVEKIDSFEVKIVYETNKILYARAYEQREIKKHQPICNIFHSVGQRDKSYMPKIKNPITVKDFDKWLNKEDVESIEVAEILDVSPSCLSRWRERGAIPNKHQTTLKNIVGLSRQSLQRYLRPHDSGPFR